MAEFWRQVGAETDAQLIVTASLDVRVLDREGYTTEEYVSPQDGKTYFRQVLVELTESETVDYQGETLKVLASAWSWRIELNRRRWNAGRQHSCRAVPWKRSTMALWFGDRGGIRTWSMPLVARWARNPAAMYSGPLSVSTARTGTPSRRNWRIT